MHFVINRAARTRWPPAGSLLIHNARIIDTTTVHSRTERDSRSLHNVLQSRRKQREASSSCLSRRLGEERCSPEIQIFHFCSLGDGDGDGIHGRQRARGDDSNAFFVIPVGWHIYTKTAKYYPTR